MYTPFRDIALHELTPADLAALANIGEGWFIEYKREPCKPKDYAKEAAAFANARGGWLFIGLDETAERKPAGGPGLNKADSAKFLEAARDAIIHNISPVPRFDLAVVDGPIPELGIDGSRSLLVIMVDESVNPPHIHSSGRIYKRQVDTSQPLEVTNRGELEELYSRSTRYRETVNHRLDLGFEPQWSEETRMPSVHVAVLQDPAYSKKNPISFAKFKEIVLHLSGPISLPLPDCYSTSLGHVARNHRFQKDATGAAIAFEYGFDGSFYMTVPLGITRLELALKGELYGEIGRRFGKLLQQHSFPNDSMVVDCTALAVCFFSLGNTASRIAEELSLAGPWLSRIHFQNLLRTVPFYNSEKYVNWCSSGAVPVVHRNNFTAPSGTAWNRSKSTPLEVFISQSVFVFTSLGVPFDMAADLAGETVGELLKLKAGKAEDIDA